MCVAKVHSDGSDAWDPERRQYVRTLRAGADPPVLVKIAPLPLHILHLHAKQASWLHLFLFPSNLLPVIKA